MRGVAWKPWAFSSGPHVCARQRGVQACTLSNDLFGGFKIRDTPANSRTLRQSRALGPVMSATGDAVPAVQAQKMTTAEAVVRMLIRNGIDKVFCLPGVQNDHLFDAMH